MRWSASPWDLDSLKFLQRYDIPYIKIPSALLTDDDLLQHCRYSGKRIILSTGMSTVSEIDKAVETIHNCDYALLHCNSAYPAPNEDLNLNCIKMLKDRYNCEVGYSGHEFGLSTTIASVCLGATIIERHITLDRTMYGSDQAASIENYFALLTGIRNMQLMIGDGEKKIYESEFPIAKKLRKVNDLLK